MRTALCASRRVLVALGLLLLAACGAPGYSGPRSDHFDGEVFVNQVPIEPLGFGAVMYWFLSEPRPVWPRHVENPPPSPIVERVGPGELRVTLIGHATMLVQMDGVNILTDPIYSDWSGPAALIGVERVRDPAIPFEQLPPIDAVVVSHNHYDHMDVDTLERLATEHGAPIIAGLGNAAFLEGESISGAVDLDWWASTEVSGIRITAVPVQHGSRRGSGDGNRTLWCGFVFEGPSAGRAYFGGDTGYGPHFAQVGERFGPIRLAMLPIGAYVPRRFLARVHISPAEAVRAHQELRAMTSVGMHYDTFPLGYERFGQAPRDLRRARARAGLPDDAFWTLDFGEARNVPK